MRERSPERVTRARRALEQSEGIAEAAEGIAEEAEGIAEAAEGIAAAAEGIAEAAEGYYSPDDERGCACSFARRALPTLERAGSRRANLLRSDCQWGKDTARV